MCPRNLCHRAVCRGNIYTSVLRMHMCLSWTTLTQLPRGAPGLRAQQLGGRSGWGLRGRGNQKSTFLSISGGSEMAVSPWGSRGTAWLGWEGLPGDRERGVKPGATAKAQVLDFNLQNNLKEADSLSPLTLSIALCSCSFQPFA